MPATLDDLLNAAAALRSEVKFQAEETRLQLGKTAGGTTSGGSSGGGSSSSSAGSTLANVATGAAKATIALSIFTATFDRMISALGAGLTRFVALANPGVVQRFNMAMENAMSAMGRVFIPLLEKFTLVIQSIGNAIESLSPAAKSLIAGFTAGGGLVSIFGAVATVVTLLIRTLGGIPALIITVVGAFAGILTSMSSGKEVMASLSAALKMVGGIFEGIAKVTLPIVAQTVKPIMALVGQILKEFTGIVVRVAQALAPANAAIMQIFGAVIQVAGQLLRAVMPLIEVALVPLAALISAVAQIISAVLVPILDVMARAIKSVVDFIINAVNRLRKLIGLDPLNPGPGYDPNERRAQATRQSAITDLRSAANRTYTSAFGGASANIPQQQLTESQRQTKILSDISGKLNQNNRQIQVGGVSVPDTPANRQRKADEMLHDQFHPPKRAAEHTETYIPPSKTRSWRQRFDNFNRGLMDRFRSVIGAG